MTTPARGATGAEVPAQAKINLRLKVLAREAGGHHQLETLFLRLALADTVRVRRTDGARSLDVSGLGEGEEIGPVERNLAWRAAEAYLAASGLAGGFAIELEKRIPIGGGLGGGSADAGAVLRALDAVAPEPLGEPALLRLATTLGADVPFLTATHPFALGWGRGERLLPLPPPPQRLVMLVVPPFSVNTAEAYGWLADAWASEGERPLSSELLDLGSLSRWETLETLAMNDFEPVVAARHPEIATLGAGMRDFGARPAMMSGSGSVMFGVLRDDHPDGGMMFSDRYRVFGTITATRVEPVVPLD